jgi:hypothetical protein
MIEKSCEEVRGRSLHVQHDNSLVVNAFRGKSSYFVHQQYSRGTPLDTEMTQGGSNLVDKVSLGHATILIGGLADFSYKRLDKLGD